PVHAGEDRAHGSCRAAASPESVGRGLSLAPTGWRGGTRRSCLPGRLTDGKKVAATGDTVARDRGPAPGGAARAVGRTERRPIIGLTHKAQVLRCQGLVPRL